jgi:thioredoxin:protein disulfide reductase
MMVDPLLPSRNSSSRIQPVEVRRRFAAGILVTLLLILFSTALALASPRDVVTIQSIALPKPLRHGESGLLVIAAQIRPGWHINSDRPLGDYYIPTRISLTMPPGIVAGPVQYPPAQVVSLKFAKNEKLSLFTGAVDFKIPVKATSAFETGTAAPVVARIDYQACNDQQCLRPTFAVSTVDLASASSSVRTPSSVTENAVGRGFDAEEISLTDIFAHHGYLIGFLAVLLGGIALNLTPCVYPLIGVTIAYFGNEGGAPRKVIALAVTYVLGIALMFSSVGVAVALSGGLFGAALQNPYVLSAIAAMLLMLAASSFGLFSLQPPQWMMRWAGTARPGYVGALAMGLGMGVVAAPCIGPIVLGLLLMVQRSGSAIFGFALFFTLAIGLGLPYIALALAAGSIRRLPRSGEWLAWVEQLFGFVLIGLALYFLDSVVPNRLMTQILPYYVTAASIFLGFLSRAGRAWRPFLLLRWTVGIASVLALAYMVIPGRSATVKLTFKPFDRTFLQAAAAERKPVVVDFSADWCVPCREMEHTTFVDPSVVRQAGGFVRLRANLTAENADSRALMRQFNIEGVPTTVFIDSSGKIRKRRVGYIGPAEFLRYLHEFG